MRYQGIIFDMDGTITIPIIDFDKLRNALGIKEADILLTVVQKPEPERTELLQIIEKYESEAAEKNKLQPNSHRVLCRFRKADLRLAILTRNTQKSAEILVNRLDVDFDFVLSRDFPFVKPDPRPVKHIISKWGFSSEKVLMVGDYIHDIECGKNAGADTCYFHNDGTDESFGKNADYLVKSFNQLEDIVFNQNIC